MVGMKSKSGHPGDHKSEEQRSGGRSESCSFCQKPTVVRLREPNRSLCAEHFIQDCEERVKRAVEAEGMIAPGDRIAVGLSGGKDSTALLMILEKIFSSTDIELVAITIDEGISGYREETMAAAVELTRRLAIPQQIVSFCELFGRDLDSLLCRREKEACTVCGVLRRRALLEGARRAGATKIATGHNLDDEAQSVLMNVLRGDLPRLLQDTSSGYPECFIPRIKPLIPLSEKEIVIFLMVQGAFMDLPECPYAHTALRGEVREMLADLEFHHPGTREKLIHARNMVRERISGNFVGESTRGGNLITHCRICGEVCSSEICAVCRVLGDVANIT